MAGPIDQPEEPQIAHSTPHHFDQVDARQETQHGVETACNEGGRLFYALVGHRRLLLEIKLRCAIAVERAAEATLLKLMDVVVEVGRGKPVRKDVGIGKAVEQSRICRFVEPWAGLHSLAGGPVVDLAQAATHVRFQLGLGNPCGLEVELIEKAVLIDPPEEFNARRRPATGVRHAKTSYCTYFLGMKQRGIPDDGCAPI